MKIRQASLAEAVEVLVRISEFALPADENTLQARLKGKPTLILVAEQDEQLVGVKIGYRLSETCFYSWLGGVAPEGAVAEWPRLCWKPKKLGWLSKVLKSYGSNRVTVFQRC